MPNLTIAVCNLVFVEVIPFNFAAIYSISPCGSLLNHLTSVLSNMYVAVTLSQGSDLYIQNRAQTLYLHKWKWDIKFDINETAF